LTNPKKVQPPLPRCRHYQSINPDIITGSFAAS
jgi:hypothetical protein